MQKCPICRRPCEIARVPSATPFSVGPGLDYRRHDDHAQFVTCPACGDFLISDQDVDNLPAELRRHRSTPSMLSALVRERTLRKEWPFWLQCGMSPYGRLDHRRQVTPIDVSELLRRWPSTVGERLNRTILNLAAWTERPGKERSLEIDQFFMAFAEDRDEMHFSISSLAQRGLIRHGLTSTSFANLSLTADGWHVVDELTRTSRSPANPVFVAMWYGAEPADVEWMKQVYEHGIQAAVEQAGYRATRADLEEHNDWIMDKVVGAIRVAPFVVADFNKHRNGVYYEAGLAKGLGVPVIHTCPAEAFHHAHFDTAQLNHVKWSSIEELAYKLHLRITATVGPGPTIKGGSAPQMVNSQ